jgi:hypothetical protein
MKRGRERTALLGAPNLRGGEATTRRDDVRPGRGSLRGGVGVRRLCGARAAAAEKADNQRERDDRRNRVSLPHADGISPEVRVHKARCRWGGCIAQLLGTHEEFPIPVGVRLTVDVQLPHIAPTQREWERPEIHRDRDVDEGAGCCTGWTAHLELTLDP